MKKLAFICTRGLDTFIEPIVREFEKDAAYQVRRFYVTTNQEIIAAVKWADIVWLEWANEVAIIASQMYDMKKKGVIVRLHSYEALSPMPTQINWINVDYLVFVASHIMDIVKGKLPNIEKLTCPKIVPNGVDIDAIPVMEPGDPHEIAYVANINHKKAPELALQIMAALVAKDPAFRLHIAGAYQDERYQIYMKHMMSDMGIEQNVIMYGFVQDMEQFWKGKGAILSTSIHEGHPLNIIEGMARGIRPVIHNFYGARRLYQSEWLFNTVDEAVDLLTQLSGPTGVIRHHVIDRGWTLAEQMRQFKKLVAKAGEKRK